MKRILLSIAIAAGVSAASAQSLALPDSASTVPTDSIAKQSTYNTPSESYKPERNAIRRGNNFFENKQYHQALEAYNEALMVNGGSIRAKYNKAVTLYELQNEDNKGTANDPRVEASQLLKDLIDDAKRYDSEIAEKAYYNLGNVAYNDANYGESIEMYKNALRINPDNLQTRENLRLAQLKKQEQEQQQQDQQQDKQDQQQQQEQQQEQQQQDQQQDQQQEQQQQQQQQQQPMTQSAQQILQSMQNKENATRRKVKEEQQPAGRPQTDKPW